SLGRRQGTNAAVSELLRDGGPDGRGAPVADPRDLAQAAVVSGDLEGLERVDVQDVVDAGRQLRAHAGQRLEQLLGLQLALQALELAPASGGRHLQDGQADAPPDPRQLREAAQPVAAGDVRDRLFQAQERIGGTSVGGDAKPVGPLLLEQVRHLAQLAGNGTVDGRHGGFARLDSLAPRSTADRGTRGRRRPRRGDRLVPRKARQGFLISILRSALIASGFFAAVTFSTPLSNLASTLFSSTVSGRRMERAKLPKLRSAR